MTFPTFTWPDWKQAPRGTRFRHNMTGKTGTLIGSARTTNNGAIVVWDDVPFRIRRPVLNEVENSVFFIGIARDATPIPTEETA